MHSSSDRLFVLDTSTLNMLDAIDVPEARLIFQKRGDTKLYHFSVVSSDNIMYLLVRDFRYLRS